MYKLIKLLLQFIVASIFCGSLFAQQQVSLDWKMHNVGQVRQFISNIGSLWPKGYSDFTGLIYCEFPPNSFEEHVGEGGIWVGAIMGDDSLVSVTSSWHSSVEFYPSAAPYDTIWVVLKGDTVDIPYWQDYTAISDQDFVCKFNDYEITNIALHTPLYLEVIQTSHAWSSPPLDEMIVFNYYVTATKNDLKDVYIAYWLDGNVGYRGQGWSFALDDYSIYHADKHLGIAMDWEGRADGTAYSPIGIKIYAPEDIPEESLKWTYNWIENPDFGPPGRDGARYAEMAVGVIKQEQREPVGSQFFISCGPFDLNKNDTLHFIIGEILGEGLDGLMENAEQLDWLVENDFHVPSPPPCPPLRIETKSRQVTLKWKAQQGDSDPETYQDPYRADSVKVPFEGYRVYKSTYSATGPWTLLAEYDIADNGYENDIGLQYEYTDYGLLNNLEYFYTVIAFAKPDTVSNFLFLESSKAANAKTVIPGTESPETVGQVAVIPNPYRGDMAYQSYNPPWEKPDQSRDRWMEQDRRVQFINLPKICEIRIYTVAGNWVTTIPHNNPNKGYEDWNLTSKVGQAISSGIYLFTVEDSNNGKVQVGKFVVIK